MRDASMAHYIVSLSCMDIQYAWMYRTPWGLVVHEFFIDLDPFPFFKNESSPVTEEMLGGRDALKISQLFKWAATATRGATVMRSV